MSLVNTQAVILKSQRWGEADRIVTFFTLRFGKVRGIARGARRMKNRFGSGLEPFSHVGLTVFEKGNDSLARISQVDVKNSFWGFRENMDCINAAARMVNLVSAVSGERDPNAPMFWSLLNGLRTLEESPDHALTALIFQIHFLGLTGFRPQTDHCASCGRSFSGKAAGFSPLSGGLICGPCECSALDHCLPMSPGSLAFIHHARQYDFPHVMRLKAEGQVRHEVKEAIESYINVVVGARLPLPIV